MNKKSTKGFLRPPAEILDEKALIPGKNLIDPPPNQFTHEAAQALPFYYDTYQGGKQTPDGELPKGTKVVLLVYDGGEDCRIVDGQGLYVTVDYNKLQKM